MTAFWTMLGDPAVDGYWQNIARSLGIDDEGGEIHLDVGDDESVTLPNMSARETGKVRLQVEFEIQSQDKYCNWSQKTLSGVYSDKGVPKSVQLLLRARGSAVDPSTSSRKRRTDAEVRRILCPTVHSGACVYECNVCAVCTFSFFS